MTIQMKGTEHYFPVVLLYLLCCKKGIACTIFEFVGKILKCDHSDESGLAVLSCAQENTVN